MSMEMVHSTETSNTSMAMAMEMEPRMETGRVNVGSKRIVDFSRDLDSFA